MLPVKAFCPKSSSCGFSNWPIYLCIGPTKLFRTDGVSKGSPTSLFHKILIHWGYSGLDQEARAKTDYKMLLVTSHSVYLFKRYRNSGTADFPAL
jgi:hypothetical protein